MCTAADKYTYIHVFLYICTQGWQGMCMVFVPIQGGWQRMGVAIYVSIQLDGGACVWLSVHL